MTQDTITATCESDRRVSIEHARNLGIILILGLIMVGLAWVGYVGTDDQSYARGALGWLTKFPYIGDTQWALRHCVVIPLALSITIFGYREISLALPSVFFFLTLLSVSYYYLQLFFNRRFALLASVFMATTPLFVVYATLAQTVLVEILVLSISFWLFYSATRQPQPTWPMFASGVTAGLGFVTRETSAALLLFYCILFLCGFGMRRRYYWIMALGFLLITGTEIAYFGALTGDPFYRYHIDASNAVANTALIFDKSDALIFDKSHVLTVQGNWAVGGAIFQPIFALLFNQEFGLIFWALIPAAIWACRTNTKRPVEQRLLQLLTTLGIVWMIFISYTGLLAIVPRFYTVSVWAATIVIAYWLHYYVAFHWPKAEIFLGVSLVTANLLCIYVENKNPAFAERALIAYVVQHRAVVYTDPTTFRVARLLSEFKGVSDRIRSDSVPRGGLFFFNKKNIDYCKEYGCKYSWDQYVPEDTWDVVKRIEPQRKLSGILLASVGLDRVIPSAIFERLNSPNPGAILYVRPFNEGAVPRH